MIPVKYVTTYRKQAIDRMGYKIYNELPHRDLCTPTLSIKCKRQQIAFFLLQMSGLGEVWEWRIQKYAKCILHV